MAFYKNVKNLSNIGLKGVAKSAATGTKKAAVGAKNASGKFISEKVRPTKVFVDASTSGGRPKERLDNLYTGKKVNPWLAGGAGAALLTASSAKQAWNYEVFGKLEKATNYDVQEYGAPDIMMYDGVGQERAPRNLNANGSLVFGLHNMRKG